MKALGLIGVFASIIAVSAAVFFFGPIWAPLPGRFNMFAKRRSVGMQSMPPISMDDQATIQTGAHAFASRGCTNCHGGPGVTWAKFSEGLRPDPPDFKEAAKDPAPAEILWVVRNAINMTAMPGRIGGYPASQ